MHASIRLVERAGGWAGGGGGGGPREDEAARVDGGLDVDDDDEDDENVSDDDEQVDVGESLDESIDELPQLPTLLDVYAPPFDVFEY